MRFSWTPDYALNQPAARVLVMLKAARRMEFEKEARHYYELTKVALCAQADTQWITKYQTHLLARVVAQPSRQMDNGEAAARLARIQGSDGHRKAGG